MTSTFLDFPNERTEFSDAGYSALGRALTYATAFEAVCRSLSSLQHVKCRVSELQKVSPEGSDVFAIAIGEIWDQRLRQHIKKISEQQGWYFRSDVAVTLAKAREARNQIAHEAALGLPRKIELNFECYEFLARIALLVEEIALGFMIVELTSLVETREPFPTFDFFAEYPQRIVRWVNADMQANRSLAVVERRAGEEQEFEIAPGVKIVMCWIPPGEFLMGCPVDEVGRLSGETQHRVTLTQGFWLGKYQLTQLQWQAVMGNNPSHWEGSNLPVEKVSWNEISEPGGFMEKVNRFAAAGGFFSLPTEAQWEYACRAGTATALNNGENLTSKDYACPNVNEVAWYDENSGNRTHPVGLKKANAWGLHDMHGNVLEWCLDRFGHRTDGPLVDPRGAVSGAIRVLRGGSWNSRAFKCRAAYRDDYYYPSTKIAGIGFRVFRNSGPRMTDLFKETAQRETSEETE